ncbi:squalene synthase HpnC [Rhodoblastus acidophilus]|uniref:Squalene synthase HpnC n=1 Tax=Candidatus Rhodoblastus alkanivorans TaxID=2954117 RepID=A0ABS9Z903_9HYPH|nr:squalene synthase HpnC [Candidatus Rhodoblastus alkanivorans]MCI4678913.1 squalene synthase HpnC [Candidatus Rhodoblastus alkanivorans]MCI4684163.1 squalene synthase HpnC [Candidatus Rhodoblastus alkanivorans]MDI4641484.1 squalene synthase HpnC [Rhodoblastus acidophilus]
MSAAARQVEPAPVTAESLRSGKGGNDENFPVASLLIASPLRPVIFAFYDFVRAGDDVADHPDLAPAQKRALLDQLDQSLTGASDAEPLGVKLRAKLAECGLTDRHARDLLDAFRRDVDQNRYATWDELIDYCRLSAMPVGRFLLDVHGESRDLWPASDAICAALQINNHLQDCGKDFRALDRVYVPQDALAAAGARAEDLGAGKATPALRACLRDLALRNRGLLAEGMSLPHDIKDLRLGMEIAVIVRHAFTIADLLIARDPLSENVRLSKSGMLIGAIAAAMGEAVSRLTRRAA